MWGSVKECGWTVGECGGECSGVCGNVRECEGTVGKCWTIVRGVWG